MNFQQVIAFLERYPDDHPSPIRLGRVQGSTNVFKVIPAETTVASLLDLLWATLNSIGHNVKLLPNADDTTSLQCHDLSPHLLRAWLGPVPVVLPEGCSVDPVSKVRRYHLNDHICIVYHAQSCISIRYGGCFEDLDPVALEWLRTGNINNNGETA